MRTRSIEQQKRIVSQQARLHLAIKKMETAKALMVAAFNIARDPSSVEAYQVGRAALKAAFGHEYLVGRDDLLKILLSSAISFSSES